MEELGREMAGSSIVQEFHRLCIFGPNFVTPLSPPVGSYFVPFPDRWYHQNREQEEGSRRGATRQGRIRSRPCQGLLFFPECRHPECPGSHSIEPWNGVTVLLLLGTSADPVILFRSNIKIVSNGSPPLDQYRSFLSSPVFTRLVGLSLSGEATEAMSYDRRALVLSLGCRNVSLNSGVEGGGASSRAGGGAGCGRGGERGRRGNCGRGGGRARGQGTSRFSNAN